MDAILAAVSRQEGVERREVSDTEILETLDLSDDQRRRENLGEGIAASATDIDLIWLHGYNWPRHKGDPMHYGSEYGRKRIAEALAHYAEIIGDETLKPAPLLSEL